MTGWLTERKRRIFAGVLLLVTWYTCSQAHAQSPAPATTSAAPAFVPGEILVKFKSGAAAEKISSLFATAGIRSMQHFASLDVHRCSVPPGTDVAAAVRACKLDPAIEFAEPNYIYTASRTPNDPRFGELWGMQNATDADVDAPEAWDRQTGARRVLVAIIDTGIDYKHQDLGENVWRNPGESGGGRETNGKDDDGNGFVDDVFGWDFANRDNDPMDDNGHGSHVAGTIAAVGDNNLGVVGVNWRASVMALKFLSASGSGSASDAIEAILYAANNGARVLNNSWGGGGFSQALRDAIEFARERNAVFVAAAGNDGRDNDAAPEYPASYDLANILSIAASDRQDARASFSNFGKTSVDLAAPGVDILSTTPGNTYSIFSGTSMATPHASGVAALVLAQYPLATSREVLIRMAGSVDPLPAFENTTSSGGRLNAAAALAPAPKVAFVTRIDPAAVPVGPYPIEAEAVGDTDITAVRLQVAVQGAQPATIPMQKAADASYRAEIPAQANGARVEYYVEAADASGGLARSRSFVFTTGQNAGGPACGGFSLRSKDRAQTRVLVALGNALLLLLGLQGAQKLRHRRRSF